MDNFIHILNFCPGLVLTIEDDFIQYIQPDTTQRHST